jgi:hypothetical protein
VKNILEELPVIDFERACKKCGSTDWAGASLGDGVISHCSNCPDAHEFVGESLPHHCRHCGANGFDQNLPESCPGKVN